MKNEPKWMLDFRLRAYKLFKNKPTPSWEGDLTEIDYDNIFYYLKPTKDENKSWDDVPAEMKNTFERLGIPQAEREYLAGVKAQFDSEVIYGSLQAELQEQGVIFLGTDDALKKYPQYFEEYFGKVIPPTDNKFAALNSATWSGGSFVYIPKGAKLTRPLQAYFRINAENMGQFERTLIIADEGSYAHYVEGCFTAGHLVQTQEGFKKIEDIQKTDLVLTHTGSFKPVYHTQVRPYTGKLFNINVWGNTTHPIEVTEEHPFLAVKTFGEIPDWVNASALSVGHLLCMPKSLGKDQYLTLPADDNYIYVPITEISSRLVSEIPVYNFSVKDDESYTCNLFVVHNCTAPTYSSDSLHSAVVEVIVKPGARFRYTTIQNWSNNVYNLVTKRARVEKDGVMEWIDGNLGSRLTMKYPSCYLVGEGAHGEVLSIAYGGRNQHQDAGAKMVHLAPNTTSTIVSKSISANGGRTSYRGLVSIS
jgi:Fe-S cluster assembly scaffold protein SufB